MQRLLTIVASGALTKRQAVLHALNKADYVDASEQPLEHSHGLPLDPKLGWVTVYADELDPVRELLMAQRWQVRLHSLTPACAVCEGRGANASGQDCLACRGTGHRNHPKPPQAVVSVAQELAELRNRVRALEGRKAI